MEGNESISNDKEIFNAPKKTHKSNVWQYFGFFKRGGQLDKTHAICKQCRGAIKYVSSTTNLATHMKRRHGVDISAAATPSFSSDPAETRATLSSSKGGDRSIASLFRQNTPLAANSARSQAITDAIAYFICKDIQSYSVVENEGFKELVHILDPRYKIPQRAFFTDTQIPALYIKVKKEVMESLSNAKRVAITVDGWTSCATHSYITVTSHHIDNEWNMKNYVLQTRIYNEAHTGQNLSVFLRDVCCEWKLEDKKPALVTDNARNMLLAGAGADMEPHIRCIAHTLNLSSQKALKVETVSALLVKIRKLVTFFHKSPKACGALHEVQAQLKLKDHKLIHDVTTRWNSSLDMMERLWEQQAAVTLTTRKMKSRSRGENLPDLTEEDITLMPEIIKLLTPLKTATKCLSEEKTPTISIIAPTLAKLLEHFDPDDSDLPVISEMKDKFRQDFSTRYTYIQDFLWKASALDPRFKALEFLDDDHTRDTVYLGITAEVENMATNPENEQSSHREEEDEDDDPEPPMKKSALDLMFGSFSSPRAQKKSSRERAKEETAKYRGRVRSAW
ncbi:hypothetical protein MHYP_G00013590 [Metynnis hypsauchen]